MVPIFGKAVTKIAVRLKQIKSGDRIVILFVLLAAVAAGILLLLPKNPGKTVTVKQNNRTVFCLALSDDQTVSLPGNEIVIKNGKVFVRSADCKNQICVHHAPISQVGETILCLPNRVSITIGGDAP